jgi:hypothetical protein
VDTPFVKQDQEREQAENSCGSGCRRRPQILEPLQTVTVKSVSDKGIERAL